MINFNFFFLNFNIIYLIKCFNTITEENAEIAPSTSKLGAITQFFFSNPIFRK